MKSYHLVLFLPLVISNINNSSVQVEDYVKTETTGKNSKVETNISTKVNQTETTVKTKESGEVEVKIRDDKVEVRTSKGITPTIIIKGNKITPTISLAEPKEKKSENKREIKNIESKIYYFLKGLFGNIFSFFHREK